MASVIEFCSIRISIPPRLCIVFFFANEATCTSGARFESKVGSYTVQKEGQMRPFLIPKSGASLHKMSRFCEPVSVYCFHPIHHCLQASMWHLHNVSCCDINCMNVIKNASLRNYPSSSQYLLFESASASQDNAFMWTSVSLFWEARSSDRKERLIIIKR